MVQPDTASRGNTLCRTNSHHTAAWHLPAILNAALHELRKKEEMGKSDLCEMSQTIFHGNAHVVGGGAETVMTWSCTIASSFK